MPGALPRGSPPPSPAPRPEATMEFQILISGAGPVGLTLAMDLARRGIRVGIMEIRRRGELPSVKCNHVAARSMEAFRLLGIADTIRNAGLPREYPNDCVYRTTVTGEEITRVPIPSAAERRTGFDGPDTWWPTPEPAHRINQIFLSRSCLRMPWRIRTSRYSMKPSWSKQSRMITASARLSAIWPPAPPPH